jgi:dTDP-4-dehydrorhamnose 3,5-epimerase
MASRLLSSNLRPNFISAAKYRVFMSLPAQYPDNARWLYIPSVPSPPSIAAPVKSPISPKLKCSMEVFDTSLRDVKLLRPQKSGDERGWFSEVFNARTFAAAGFPDRFVQDNQSFSRRGVLRGLHYQVLQPQGKLIGSISGHIWDVAVDLRPQSPDFGKWAGFHLLGDEMDFLWIPEGFAHGFVVLSETASVMYKTTDFYCPAGERCVRWDDPTLGIVWPLDGIDAPLISAKDAKGSFLQDAELPLPVGLAHIIA